MTKPTIKDIIPIMEDIAPPDLALPDDKIGLQVGEENISVDAILLCLDVTKNIVEEAKERGANLIIAHHPLIYTPLRQLHFSRPPVDAIKEALNYNISIYIAHTNLDVVPGGVNDALLKTLEPDLKIEMKEPLLPVRGKPEIGLGKFVSLENEKDLWEIVSAVKKRLATQNIRVGGAENHKIRKIALCAGNCRELIYPACQKGAQLFLTGELGYHSLLEAKSLGLSVIEAGHYETEVVILPFLKQKLEEKFKEKNWKVKIFKSEVCTSPYLTKSLS